MSRPRGRIVLKADRESLLYRQWGRNVTARYLVPGEPYSVGEVQMLCYKGHLAYGAKDTKHCRVVASIVSSAFQRQGIATALYTRLAKEAKKMGASFHSDKHVSYQARKLWDSFVAKGWAVPTEGRYFYRWVKP